MSVSGWSSLLQNYREVELGVLKLIAVCVVGQLLIRRSFYTVSCTYPTRSFNALHYISVCVTDSLPNNFIRVRYFCNIISIQVDCFEIRRRHELNSFRITPRRHSQR